MSTPELEAELLSLAGHLAAAQCRFLGLLAEFDRRGGWAGPGLRSCAHWLSWRAGMSLRTAFEHVRVAHALPGLPKVTEAFAAGRISYSKVRAITRVVGPEPAASRSADPADIPEPTDLSDPSGPTGSREPTGSTCPVASTTPTTPTELAAGAGHDAGTEDSEQVLLDLALAGTASHVEKVVRATRRMRADPATAAAQRAVSWRWAEDGSLVLRGRFPAAEGAALVAAIEARSGVPDKSISGVVEPPGAVADCIAARRADALLALAEGGSADTAREVVRGEAQVVVHIEVGSGSARIEAGPEIPVTTAERMACDAHAQVLLEDTAGNRLYLGRSRRLASPAQIAALTVRDEGCCQFAGCSRTRHLRAHHVRHWFHGGRTDLDNLVLLCGFHHSLVHDRGYRLHRVEGRWHTRCSDGTPVPTAGPPLTGDTESFLESHTRAGLAITPDTLTPTWTGERLDPTTILQRLLPPPATAAVA